MAGVTISLVFSENGIIAKAREAAEKTNQAVVNEQEEMNKVADYMSNMVNGTGGSTPEEPEDPTANWDLNKVNKVESTDGVVVPVPKGYIASSIAIESTVSDGFVIYEGEEAVNEENKKTAQATRNQFVWVPVENPSEMYGTDSNGKNVISLIDLEDIREPDIVTRYDGNDATYDASEFIPIIGNITGKQFKTQLENEFNSMIESIEKYEGFYIGRYETGNLSQTEVAVVKNNTDINNQTWYTQYNKAKGIAANSNVTTTMIWGCQWDAVLRWMYNSGDAEKKTYICNSTGKGNYKDTNGNQTIATGSNDLYAVNNIYDMAGNVYDWTIETRNAYGRVIRGGCYYETSITSVSYRNNGTPSMPRH